MRRSLRLPLAAFGVLALCACPPLEPDPPTDAGPTGEDPVVTALVEAYNTLLDNCDFGSGPQGPFVDAIEPDGREDPQVAAIRARISATIQGFIDNPNIEVDESQLEGCVAELTSPEACQSGPGAACEALFVGQLGDGEICGEDLECVSGYCEELDYNTGCGRCAPGFGGGTDRPGEEPPPGPPQEDPAVPLPPGCLADGCPDGEYCHDSPASPEPVCLPYLTEGDACIVEDVDFVESFECDPAALYCAQDTGLCTALPLEGESCQEAQRCSSGLLCDVTNNTCVVAPEVGQPCVNDTCGEGALCNFELNTCVAPPAENEPCVQGRCAVGLFCYSEENATGQRPPEPAPDRDGADAFPIQGEEGICTVYVEGEVEGDPCLPGYGCGGGTLESGLACEGTLGDAVCVPAVVVDEGEPCNTFGEYDNDASRFCLHGLSTHYCAIAEGESAGVCQARPSAGDVCDDLTPCVPGEALCLPADFTNFDAGQRCVPYQQEGEPCRPEEINADFDLTLCAPVLTCGPDDTCIVEGTLTAGQCVEAGVTGGGSTGGSGTGGVEPGGP